MRVGRWVFRPGLLPSLATAALLPLLVALGFWQLDRAAEKQALYDAYLARRDGAPVDLNRGVPPAPADMIWRPAAARGTFVPDRQVLLDNQIMQDRVGYLVFAVLDLDGAGAVLVNRGWVPAAPDRARIPNVDLPGGAQRLSGRITPPPVTGLQLGEWQAETLGNGVLRVTKLDIARLAPLLGRTLPPWVLRLEPPAPEGFARDWREPGRGQARHLGYAFQWFAMALALVCIYLFVNVKRADSHE